MKKRLQKARQEKTRTTLSYRITSERSLRLHYLGRMLDVR
jgi:hypothetical protein